jgi:hypothetical protein
MPIKHSEELKEAATLVHEQVLELTSVDTHKVVNNVLLKYCGSEYNYPLWENLDSYTGIIFPYPWKWFSEMLEKQKVLLFFEPNEGDISFQINNGSVLSSILENAYQFTFYLTNEESSFLLCCNDHDNLIASGDAIAWLHSYVLRHHPGLKLYSHSVK